MRPTSLYEYLIMLVFIFGGGALVLKVLCKPKYKSFDDDNNTFEQIEELADKLEDLKRNMR